MPKGKHNVNVIFTESQYVKFVLEAAELTVKEGRRVSVAELVRRLVLGNDGELQPEMKAADLR